MKYSIIIPVYNRPDEVEELLESLTHQTVTDFEVIIVEDGSAVPCKSVVSTFTDRLDVHYFDKPNSGPGLTRNFGAEHAHGEWLIIFDSDIIVPKDYFHAVDTFLADHPDVDAFGGPDRAHKSFTPIQKAISYSMTSFFTTGGIRGQKDALDKFYPRSFNMGIRRSVYRNLGGFSKMRFGEDVDFSLRIVEAGYHTALIEKAFVYHKRRTDFAKFWRQVFNSGKARINLYLLHPKSLKPVHVLPTVFTFGVALLVTIGTFLPMVSKYFSWAWFLLVLYATMIFFDSLFRNHMSFKIAGLSVAASFVQLFGYGLGFFTAWWKRIVLHQDDFAAYEENFYK